MALQTVDARGPARPEPWITDPGVYDLNDSQYHGDPVVGGSLSSTGARAILPPHGSPARFRHDQLYGRPDTRAFDVGRAAHREVLGVGDEIEVIAGSGSDENSWRTNDDRAAVQAARDAGKTPVTPKDARIVKAMAAELRKHPVAGPLLERSGMAEHSFVACDPESGVMCRVRADWVPDGRELVVDYKTTKSAEPGQFAKSVAEYGYHQQGAFYLDVLRWLDLTGEDARFMLVAQEKTPPYLACVFELDSDAVRWGRKLNARARELFRDCTASGLWPGYPTEPQTLTLPRWLVSGYEEEFGASNVIEMDAPAAVSMRSEPGPELVTLPPGQPVVTSPTPVLSAVADSFAGQVFAHVKAYTDAQRLLDAVRRVGEDVRASEQTLLDLYRTNARIWRDEHTVAAGEASAAIAKRVAAGSRAVAS
jgi:hypothetical protein